MLSLVKQLESYESKALGLIKSNGGVMYQSELWKKLELDSREGSRLVQRLLKKGLIRREKVLVNGRKTFKLYIVESNSRDPVLHVSIESILGIPCTVCPYIDQCELGGFYEPMTCILLDSWIDKMLASKEKRIY